VFDANPAMIEPAAFRNSSLQGAYLILAARALGLDCGAMSGFNPQAVNEAFFPDGRFKANFLLNIGMADPAGIYPRAPRLAFEQAAQIV
jgi:nitroreductase